MHTDKRFDENAKAYLSKPFPGYDTSYPKVLNYVGRKDKW
jgi:hypothetical protein